VKVRHDQEQQRLALVIDAPSPTRSSAKPSNSSPPSPPPARCALFSRNLSLNLTYRLRPSATEIWSPAGAYDRCTRQGVRRSVAKAIRVEVGVRTGRLPDRDRETSCCAGKHRRTARGTS
jgi:hypothetical protein